jgi:hypothetical protein
VILYRGPSLIDGAPIVAVATTGSSNRKTGDMVQTWILREDMDPVAASRAGADSSVCGDCPHRWSLDGGCYVNLGQAPLAVWRGVQRGTYDSDERVQHVTAALATGTPLRIGSYGDPMAVPWLVWTDLLDIARVSGRARWTGYTHRWADVRADRARYRDFLMASVDSEAQSAEAERQGWRYFMVGAGIPSAERWTANEVECVADSHGKSCLECGLCDGTRFGTRPAGQVASIYIAPHGARVKRVAALKVVAS